MRPYQSNKGYCHVTDWSALTGSVGICGRHDAHWPAAFTSVGPFAEDMVGSDRSLGSVFNSSSSIIYIILYHAVGFNICGISMNSQALRSTISHKDLNILLDANVFMSVPERA